MRSLGRQLVINQLLISSQPRWQWVLCIGYKYILVYRPAQTSKASRAAPRAGQCRENHRVRPASGSPTLSKLYTFIYSTVLKQIHFLLRDISRVFCGHGAVGHLVIIRRSWDDTYPCRRSAVESLWKSFTFWVAICRGWEIPCHNPASQNTVKQTGLTEIETQKRPQGDHYSRGFADILFFRLVPHRGCSCRYTIMGWAKYWRDFGSRRSPDQLFRWWLSKAVNRWDANKSEECVRSSVCRLFYQICTVRGTRNKKWFCCRVTETVS
jgi:hypothetical protein